MTSTKNKMPSGFVSLGRATPLPPEGNTFLTLVLSPSFEVGMLAGQTENAQESGAEQQEGKEYQYINADTALLVVDVLLAHLSDLLPHASAEFIQQEHERMTRLRNVHQSIKKEVQQ